MTNEEIMKLAHAAGWEQGLQSDDCGDCSRFDVVKFARMVDEVGCKRVDAEQQASSDMADAYAGAREDIEIWKKRALEAEELNRKFIAGINGQTYMGEPAASPTAGMNLGERTLMHETSVEFLRLEAENEALRDVLRYIANVGEPWQRDYLIREIQAAAEAALLGKDSAVIAKDTSR